MMDLTELEEVWESAFCSPADSVVFRPVKGTPVACLIGLVSGRGVAILPISSGTNLVGRSNAADYVENKKMLAGIVEGAQWRIVWQPGRVTVEDTGSTNGSALIGKRFRHLVPRAFDSLRAVDEARWLGWDGHQAHVDVLDLHDGDVLVNIFGRFLYRNSYPPKE